MPIYGLTPTGFLSKSHSELRDEARTDLQSLFGGQTVDLSSTSVLTQLTDITTNALADLWAAAADIYASAYPNGATGLQVDQLLAVNNLRRLAAVATTTDPTPVTDAGGNPIYGFVVYGTPGTVLPAGSLVSNGAATPATFSVDADIAVAAAANARQVLLFSNTPTSGSFALSLTGADGAAYQTPAISYASQATDTMLQFAAGNPLVQGWTATIDGNQAKVGQFDTTTTAAQFQAFLQSFPAYAAATVSGTRASGWAVRYAGQAATIVIGGNTGPTAILPSVQQLIRGLQAADGTFPFGDAAVSAGAQQMVLQFGAISPATGQPSSAGRPIPLVNVKQITLARGALATSVTASHQAYGAPAQGVGTATCQKAGATQVAAGQLATLVNPVAGITGATNPLDCVPGRDIESDQDALLRLRSQQTAAATGSLGAIVARVQAVDGVSQAVAFQNNTSASQQLLLFAAAPTSGAFTIGLAGQATAALPFDASPATVQAALRTIPGLSDVQVSGAGQSGYQLDFGPASGSVPHDLATVPSNTADQALSAYFGCPAHAIEVVAEGGVAASIGQAVLSALPAGIATYGRPVARLAGSVTAGSAAASMGTTAGVATGQTVTAAEVAEASTVQAVTASGVTLSRNALATNAQAALAFGYGAALTDSAGNDVFVRFSRPRAVLIYADLTLQTDSELGLRSQFNAASVATIQAKLLATINAVPIGGTVVVTGTDGLLNSFREVPGVLSCEMTIGRSPSPTGSAPVVMAADETPVAEAATVNLTVL